MLHAWLCLSTVLSCGLWNKIINFGIFFPWQTVDQPLSLCICAQKVFKTKQENLSNVEDRQETEAAYELTVKSHYECLWKFLRFRFSSKFLKKWSIFKVIYRVVEEKIMWVINMLIMVSKIDGEEVETKH